MPPGSGSVDLADVVADGRVLRIEYALIAAARTDAPLLVFLHEGLGSLAMWKDFPAALCAATGMRGLVYSRPGYGRSTPRVADERWPVDFMHRQAHLVLPALLDTLGVRAPMWLFGHSDGGSIALLFAAALPARTAGVVVVAPHIMVEDVSITSIEAARGAYANTDLRQRLARYHDDPDSAFRGWNDVWLDPLFRSWSIESELGPIACPVLAVQGRDDEYGTMAQIDGIAQRVPQTQLVKLADAGHSPHRDQPALLIAAVVAFVRKHAVDC
ncbi:MAG: alpha/beta hydrolase [Casimicrobiaceae bacterium]